jgi:2'-5' RNA ligase
MRTGKYLLAIIPPADVTGKIEHYRQEFAEEHFCKAALKPPVHMTLLNPFDMPEYFEKKLLASMGDWIAQQSVFDIHLRNFNFFDNPYHPVLYVDVVKNEQLKYFREGLCRAIKRQFSFIKDTGTFHPHFTIGYRDIPKSIFPQITQEYGRKRFEADFSMGRVCLLKHNYVNWQVHHEFSVGTHPAVMAAALQGNLFGSLSF